MLKVIKFSKRTKETIFADHAISVINNYILLLLLFGAIFAIRIFGA